MKTALAEWRATAHTGGMIPAALAALLAAAAALQAAEAQVPFFLEHERTGRKYGPFVFRDGARIELGSQVFKLQKSAAGMSLKQVMQATVIPELAFREAQVRDVINFLREAGEKHSPFEAPAVRGVNIILNVPEGWTGGRTITFSAKNLSLYDALKVVTETSNLDFSIESNWVMIRPRRRLR
jgi:hypothetical protein